MLLSRLGPDARILAGGQSLMPMLALRIASAPVLVDIGRLEALRGITREGEHIRIGALARHSEVLRHSLITEHVPLLASALPHVAHPAIRNRGTMGGSVALADPAAELPACALALGAVMEIVGPAGVRRVAAGDFFLGLYSTAIREGEMLAAVLFPIVSGSAHCFFDEVSRRSGDYALAGLAVAAGAAAGVRAVYLGCADRPVRASIVEALLEQARDKGVNHPRSEWLAAVAADLDPASDLHADRATRLHLAAVLAGRAAASFKQTAGRVSAS